jgi:monofunctional biosynthetic peptidoglycan transglycosylase
MRQRARGQGKRSRGGRRRGRLLRWLLVLALLLPVLSALPVLLLRFVDPPTSAFMLAERWSAEGEDRPDYRWRPVDQISPQLMLAVVAAEDQRFPEHHGFDVDAIRQALAEREAGERQRGASTISQQVAKNLFLWSRPSWLSKGLEAWFTVLIEALWAKQRILEIYVNIAEFGPATYGAEAAAQRYFGKPAADLQPGEAALMAAVLPSPKRYSVAAPGPHVRERQQWILRQMQQLGGVGYVERM